MRWLFYRASLRTLDQRLSHPSAAGHLTYLEYRNVFRKNGVDLNNKLIFTAVRNPWDWHVSWFHYIRQDPGGRKSGHRVEAELFANFTFADYIEWLEDPDAQRSSQGYIHRQIVDFISDAEGRIAVTDVLRQERLMSDLRDYCERHDLAVVLPSEKVNASVRSDYRTYYTEAMAEVIAKRHVDDISAFGYTF